MSRYLVLGAPGNVGRRVAERLAGPGFPDGLVEEALAGYATMAAAPPPAVTSTVRDITGAPGTTLSAWGAEHAAYFGGERR